VIGKFFRQTGLYLTYFNTNQGIYNVAMAAPFHNRKRVNA
jgi:hypothetical protein